MFPVYRVDDGFLGARASRPHKAWRSLGQLLHLDRPATAPWFSFGLAVAVFANVVAARKVALMLSDPQKDDPQKEKDAGGTPALPGAITPSWRGTAEAEPPGKATVGASLVGAQSVCPYVGGYGVDHVRLAPGDLGVE